MTDVLVWLLCRPVEALIESMGERYEFLSGSPLTPQTVYSVIFGVLLCGLYWASVSDYFEDRKRDAQYRRFIHVPRISGAVLKSESTEALAEGTARHQLQRVGKDKSLLHDAIVRFDPARVMVRVCPPQQAMVVWWQRERRRRNSTQRTRIGMPRRGGR